MAAGVSRFDFGIAGMDRSVPSATLKQLVGSPERVAKDEEIGFKLVIAVQLAYQGYPWAVSAAYEEGAALKERRFEGLSYPAWYEVSQWQADLPPSTPFSFHLNETRDYKYVSGLLKNCENELRLVAELVQKYSALHVQINLNADGVPPELFSPQEDGDESGMAEPLAVVGKLCETYKDVIFVIPFTKKAGRDGKMVDTSVFIQRLLEHKPVPANLCVFFDNSAGGGIQPDAAPTLPVNYPKGCQQMIGFTGGIDASNVRIWLERYAERANEFGCTLLSDAQTGFRFERDRAKAIDPVALTNLVVNARSWAEARHDGMSSSLTQAMTETQKTDLEKEVETKFGLPVLHTMLKDNR